MIIPVTHLPIIDWQLGIKLAGNKADVARELLDLFMSTLQKDMQTLRQLDEEKNTMALYQQVHKLHGALCYCGLPRLKMIVAQLETELKSIDLSSTPLAPLTPLTPLISTEKISRLLNQLHAEVNLLLLTFNEADQRN